MKSKIVIRLKLFSNSFVISKNREDKICNIFSISILSWFFNSDSWLFKSKTDMGSINTVDPVLDVSWINPFNSVWYSDLTGTTNLSCLIVTIGSCKYFEFRSDCNLFFISFFVFLICCLILYKALEARSSNVFSSIIAENIFSSMFGFVYRWSK